MPKNLLVADDSRTIQQAVSMTFAGEDVKVTAVADGESAFQSAKQSKPDLILADVSMPKLGGYELCQRVRGDVALRGVQSARTQRKIEESGSCAHPWE